MDLLPRLTSHSEFDALRDDASAWAPAIEAVRQRHELDEVFEPAATGSVIVYLSPSSCIKLHPPLPGDLESCRLELAFLRHLAGALPIATPTVIADGELEGWEYFVSTRLPGVAIDEVWESSSAEQRTSFAAQLGEGIRAMHDLPLGSLADFGRPWQSFVTEQRERCIGRERDRELAPARLSELDEYLRRGDALVAPAFEPALLHTEIGPGHVLVHDGRITGLIDFGDAMIGAPEYDMPGVGLFVTRGDRAAYRAFCDGYGYTGAQLADPGRPHRLLRHALLHRYGTLAWYLRELAPPDVTLEELAQVWFGVGD